MIRIFSFSDNELIFPLREKFIVICRQPLIVHYYQKICLKIENNEILKEYSDGDIGHD